ncbi:MAG: FtsX-like permease family protein [Cryobacterium sp.]|nr:FtsX-like permease family protein [Cryobacterium sp.]
MELFIGAASGTEYIEADRVLMTRNSRIGLPGLLFRQARSELGLLVSFGVITLLIAFLATAGPLAIRAMTTAEATYQFSEVPSTSLDFVARAPGTPELSPDIDRFEKFSKALDTITSGAPSPLKSTFGKAEFSVATGSLQVYRLGVEWNDPQTPISLNAAPTLSEHVKLTSGSMPAPFSSLIFNRVGSEADDAINPFVRDPRDPQIDILLSTQSAARAEWKVGEVRLVMIDKTNGFYAKLSGTFDSIDPEEGYWSASPSALTPGISHTAFSGSNTLIVTSAAFIDPNSLAVIKDETLLAMTTVVSIPFHGTGLTVENYEKLLPQLRNFTSQPHSVTNLANIGTVASVTFDSDAETALQTALERAGTATAVLVMIASGPIGICAVVLWMLARLLAIRRSTMLNLVRARGASPVKTNLNQTAGIFAISLASGVVGTSIAFALFPTTWHPIALAGPIAVGLAGPIATFVSTASVHQDARNDLVAHSNKFWRGPLELIVIVLAGISVFLLLQRGLTNSSSGVVVDPLLAATPFLLAASAGILALRLYPLPLLALLRIARRRNGIVNFLGISRVIREPVAGLAAVLALVVGISVTVFSGILLSTVSNGVESAARTSVGAQLRVDSAPLNQDQIDELKSVTGVASAVPVYQDNQLQSLEVQNIISVPVLVADTSKLAEVQSGVPGTLRLDIDMTKMHDNRLPILLSPDLANHYKLSQSSTLSGVSVLSAGSAGISSSLSGVEDWVLVDRNLAGELGIDLFLPKVTLINLSVGANVSEVADKLESIAGTGSAVTTPEEVAASIHSSPVSNVLQLALLVLIAINALLCAAVLVLSLLMLSPARQQLLTLLRTIGLARSQARGILRWETWPSAIVAIISGCALGSLMPFIVLAGVDLRPFTGGSIPPEISVNPLMLAAIGAGFFFLVLISSWLAMMLVRRLNLAKALRT